MLKLFYKAEQFNSDISGWDVSSVTRMFDMFAYAYSFNQDISGWDVSNVTEMTQMFNHALDFNQDLGDWDISSLWSSFSIFRSSGLNVCNYSETIEGWATLSSGETQIPEGLSLENDMYYPSTLQDEIYLLKNTYSWTVTDIEDSELSCD